MKRIIITSFCVTQCLFSFIFSVYGQIPDGKNNVISTALENTISFYKESAGAQLRLYNGSVYEGYRYAFKNGNPYFLKQGIDNGSVFYDGILYKNIPLRYDLLRDKLIIEHADEATQVSLVREKIGFFTLHNHTFIYLPVDSTLNTPLREGFYDQLYRGQVELLAKRVVKLQQRTLPGGVERTLRPQVKYFIKQGGSYYSVKGHRTLLKMFKDKKKALQQYARENKIGAGDNPEEGMIKLTAYYNSLKN